MGEDMKQQAPVAFCLSELSNSKKTLENIVEQLPGLRKSYEKHKSTKKEQDALAALVKAAKRLCEEIAAVVPRLSEYGDTALSDTARKLYSALSKYDYLGYTDYTGICSAVKCFADRLPTADNTVNMGKLAHLANRAKLGYYPTDIYHVNRIKEAMVFPDDTVYLLDPCCGEGFALEAFAKNTNSRTYGAELDEVRANEATDRLYRVAFGSFFHSRISLGAFQALWLNPPYLSVPSENGNRRLEKAFLSDSMRLLQNGGVLIYIVPHYRLTPDVCTVLCENFNNLRIHKFIGKEYDRFHQVAVIGVKTKCKEASKKAKRLFEYMLDTDNVPDINALPRGVYSIPKPTKKPEIFKGAVFNVAELSEQLKNSKSIERLFENTVLDKRERRPLLPLTLSQIGLVGASGMMNGLIKCDNPHVIKGRIVKEKKSKFSTEENKGEVTLREITSNKLVFNVLTPEGIKFL